MKKSTKTIYTFTVLIVVLVGASWLYTYYNGGNWKTSLFDFMKKEGLIWLIGSIFVVTVILLLKKVFKIKF